MNDRWWRIERILALRTGANTPQKTFPRASLLTAQLPERPGYYRSAAARGARPPSSSAAGMRCRPRASRPRSALLIGHLAVTIAAMRLVGLGRGATPVPFFMA